MSTKFNKAGKVLKFLLKIIVSLLFVVSIILVAVFTYRFGPGHWVTICSTEQGMSGSRAYGSIYFANKEQCDHEDWPKITVWVKDPWSFDLNFLNNIFEDNNRQIVSSKPTPTPTSTPTPTLAPSATPTRKPSSRYSVTFLTHPDLSNFWTEPVYIDVKIKNISVTPFITGLYVGGCNFVDGTNTVRHGSTQLGNGENFQKAIAPGEERTLTNQPFLLDGGGISGLNAKGQICGYDASGSYNCRMVEALKVVSCKVSISGSSDSLPMTVNVP